LENNIHWQTNKQFFRNVEGKGFVGIAFSDSFTEGLGVKLATPLKAGETYQIVTNVLMSNSCKTGLEKITIGLVDEEIDYSKKAKNFELNAIELTNQDQLLKGLTWNNISNTFVAIGNEKFLYLGNFNQQNANFIQPTKNLLIDGEESKSCNYIIFDFIELKPFEQKEERVIENVFVLEDITFEFGQAIIREEARDNLATILEKIQAVDRKLKIVGHTDNIGNEQNNKKLSFDRATAIKKYLVEHGVLANRIEVEGLGELNPKYSNSTESGRERNRRVEIIIL
jgi:outer membrane protein OmpA-like peptidoglycan-associated protein